MLGRIFVQSAPSVNAKREIEQVRKRGLPPLVNSKQQRGQAPLPDLFYSSWFDFPVVLILSQPYLALLLLVFDYARFASVCLKKQFK
jgi:hypothetical protein